MLNALTFSEINDPAIKSEGLSIEQETNAASDTVTGYYTSSSFPPDCPNTINNNRIRMSPEPYQRPTPTLIGRLLLHSLQTSRHRHFRLPILFPARQFLPHSIQHNQRRHASRAMRILDPHFNRSAAFEIGNRFAPESLVLIRFARGMVHAIIPRRDILVRRSTIPNS